MWCSIDIFTVTYFAVDLLRLFFGSMYRKYWDTQNSWIRKKCGMKTSKFSRQVLSHMWPLMALMVSIPIPMPLIIIIIFIVVKYIDTSEFIVFKPYNLNNIKWDVIRMSTIHLFYYPIEHRCNQTIEIQNTTLLSTEIRTTLPFLLFINIKICGKIFFLLT